MVATLNLNGVLQDIRVINPQIDGELAVVHLSVLQKLADLLPKASLTTIKYRIQEGIANCENLEAIVEYMKQEIAFQETVNIIQTISAEQVNSNMV